MKESRFAQDEDGLVNELLEGLEVYVHFCLLALLNMGTLGGDPSEGTKSG